MIEYLLIKDTQTGKTLQVLRESLEVSYTVIEDSTEVTIVKKQSVGKAIRNWMKETAKL